MKEEGYDGTFGGDAKKICMNEEYVTTIARVTSSDLTIVLAGTMSKALDTVVMGATFMIPLAIESYKIFRTT
ncbi:hypothetical protein V6N13_074531 [Hibiscus sabdariffa]